MIRWITGIALILAVLFSTGFIFSKSKIDTVQGVWKTEIPDGGLIRFVVIGKNSLTVDGEQHNDLVFEEKDGIVVFRNAGFDDLFGRIFIRDDTHIELELLSFLGGRVELVRSSEKEMVEALSPPVSKIVGQYSSEDGKLILKIAEDGILRNGTAVDGHIRGLNRKYYVLEGKNSTDGKHKVLFELAPMPNGSLQYNESVHSIILTKITDDDAKKLLARKELERQATGAILEKARGLWTTKIERERKIWVALELTENALIKNDESIPVIGKIINEEAVLCPVGQTDTPILIIKEISTDGNQMSISESYSSGWAQSFTAPRNYERVTPDELRMRNEPKLEDLKGFWKLESDGESTYRILAFDIDRVMRDGHVEPIESRSNRHILSILRQNERNTYTMMNITHSSKNKINVCYVGSGAGTWFTYHRLSQSEIKEEVQRTNNMVDKLAGYWKSTKPIVDGQYAYAKIQLTQPVNGKLLDIFEFLGTSKKNTDRVIKETNVLGYQEGKTDKPLYRLNNHGQGLDAFVLVDDNTMSYTEGSRDPIDFVRINEADAPSLLVKKD